MAQQSLNLPYLVLSGVIVISIVAVFTLFRGQFTAIREAREQIAATETQLRERQIFLRTLDSKRMALEAEVAHERALAVALPAEEAFDDVLRTLDVAAAASGVVIADIRNDSQSLQATFRAQRARGQRGAVPAQVVPLGVTLQLNGTYQQVRRFLQELEQSIRLIDVHSFQLQRHEAQVEQLQGNFSARFYHYEGE